MKRCMERAVALVGFVLVLALPAMAAAQELDCIECHTAGGGAAAHESGCRDTSCSESCHAKRLDLLKHSSGGSTPLASGDRTTICETCHNRPFANVYHPYTINVSAGSLTSPGVIDLDLACGQCHGGGDNSTSNPPVAGAAYLTKTQLATYAAGIHDDRPYARFGYTYGNPNTLIVNVDASLTQCFDVCDEFDWDWGDNTAHGSGLTASHIYAAGQYSIALTVRDTGMGSDTTSHPVTVTQPDYPPTVAGDCAFDANTWRETVIDASTDDRGVARVTVSWGDGAVIATDTVAPFGPFTHTYLNVASATAPYTITHKVLDTAGQMSTRTCTAAPAYFTLAGTVRSRTGTNLPSATVVVKKGTSVVRTVYTASNGTFTVASLKPATYTLTVTKSPYTFAVPAATVTVGPSSSGNILSAIAP